METKIKGVSKGLQNIWVDTLDKTVRDVISLYFLLRVDSCRSIRLSLKWGMVSFFDEFGGLG